MKRRTVAAFATGLMVMTAQLVFAAGGQAAESSQLVGVWTSFDTDGSHQTLTIHGGGSSTYAMFLYDESATSACAGAPARVAGRGTVVGDELTMSGTLTCAPGGNVIRSRLSLGFGYDAGNETLVDFSGVVWHRV